MSVLARCHTIRGNTQFTKSDNSTELPTKRQGNQRMQQMEISDYINEPPRRGQKPSGDANQAERRLCQLLFLGFGLLCIIQATLNVCLRLTESTPPDCNATHFGDKSQVKVMQECEQRRPGDCNKLQEKLNTLTREKNRLQNQNNNLSNMLKKVEEERNRLQINMRELGSCVSSQWCPPGWREINSGCYFLSTESKTWQESRKYCLSKGADLVVINSEQEQRALYRLNGNVDLLFWIGLYDTAGTFKWVDGSMLKKAFWQSGQPDRGGPNNREDCVEWYHFNPVLASWNDAPCAQKRRWLCERDPRTSS